MWGLQRFRLSLPVPLYQVDPSGTLDSAPGIQAAIDEAYSTVISAQKAANNDGVNIPVKRDVEIPAGLYRINSSLTLKQGINLRLSHAAVIKAGASMTAMLDSSPTVLLQRAAITGGLWDCNALAQTAIYLRWAIAFTVKDFRINDPTRHAIIVGDPLSTSPSYEVSIAEVDLYRPRATAAPVGYAGLWMQNVTDSWVSEIVPRGFDIGIRNDGGNNSFFRCHPWNPTGAPGPSICFDDNGSNSRWIDCYADSPSGIGFRFRGSSSYEMTNCTMYMSASGVDNVAYGIQCDGAPNLIIVGGTIYGADISHRWKQDIYVVGGGPSTLNVKFMARSDFGTVVTRTFGLRHNLHAISLSPGSDPGAVQVNGATADMWRGYNATGLVSVINANGDFYLRSDTPTIVNQRLYVRAAGAWSGIL